MNRSQSSSSLDQQLAERVRAACVQTLIAAYDQAASDGLCAEGAWEVALDQLRSLDLEPLLHQEKMQPEPPPRE
jgi:hypothetical protein